MSILSIDIETFSDIDLQKSGVYAYTASPNFQILLFAYAFDEEEVKVIDLASGEKLPLKVREALTDDTIIKAAFNATFERVCISKYLNKKLSPSSWQCTAVQAATLGLPLSLNGVAQVLGLMEQKMKEGKDLIKYFSMPCNPTKVNCGRTRNYPLNAVDKWEIFKKYCGQDVEVERAIRKKISRYPISENEQKNYVLDQEINDRGILIDFQLVAKAIDCDKLHKEHTLSDAQKLTGLDNPNSVAQLKQWLLENGIEVDSLSKRAVTDLTKETHGEVERLLNLRLQLAKTSIKKYEAIQRSVCPDGRVRGLFQFYGANRTGRWCLTGDHEVLTQKGWIKLEEWSGGEIACWNPSTEAISFEKSNALSFQYDGDMYFLESKRCSQISTPEHKMPYWSKLGFWDRDTIENLSRKRFSIPFTGQRSIRSGLEHSELRILIMTQADGHFTRDGDIRYKFKKIRKMERCKTLLRRANICFSEYKYEENLSITIKSRNAPIWLREFRKKTFDWWMLEESADVIFDELEHWDGYRCGPNSIQYSSIVKKNADVIQAIAHLSGRAATIIEKHRENEKWNTAYVVNIWLTPGGKNEIRNHPKKISYNGKVYCAETTTGYFMVRRDGKVWVTGNSGRMVQVQNLPQNHLKDLDLSRKLVKSGDFNTLEILFESIPHVLSELIRTAFIPRPNCRFIVADFSAIEARVIAWLAGEKWRMDVFATHGKIYEASASQMFRVPVEKITKTSPLRQKGKISELALGYGGGVGALTSMGALDMGIKEEELQGLVSAWRLANPNITKLWWDIDKAAVKAVKEKTTETVGRIKIHYESGIMFINLPSGRKLSYIKPRIEPNRFERDAVTYEGIGATKKWERIETYGPKLVENIVQAISRDLLAEAMKKVAEKGYEIVMHVHDEVVIETPVGYGSLKEVCDVMAIIPTWAEGLKLRADGFECDYYRKD